VERRMVMMKPGNRVNTVRARKSRSRSNSRARGILGPGKAKRRRGS